MFAQATRNFRGTGVDFFNQKASLQQLPLPQWKCGCQRNMQQLSYLEIQQTGVTEETFLNLRQDCLASMDVFNLLKNRYEKNVNSSDENYLRGQIDRFRDIGVTDFNAAVVDVEPGARERTLDFLASLNA